MNVRMAAVAARFEIDRDQVELSVAGATQLTFKSGTTALSGPYNISGAGVLRISNGGVPVLIGDDIGEAITADNSGSVQLSGFVVVVEVDSTAMPK